MNKNYKIIISTTILIIFVVVFQFAKTRNVDDLNSQSIENTEMQLVAMNQISLKDALDKAVDDEYKAYTTYTKIIETFGEVQPFVNIRKAEMKHIDSLGNLYKKYGIVKPENGYTVDQIEIPGSLTEICALGVQAEIDNVKLYEEQLLSAVAEYSDVTQVFTSLMNASRDNHLPAFERCAKQQ